jgi:hypothetical protein
MFCPINFFWNRLFLQSVNTNIWISAPAIIDIPAPLTQLQSDYTTIPTENIIREEDIYYKLSSISSSKAAGPDEIPNWVLKDYAPLLAPPVTSTFNASLQQASVPAVWKKADAIPVPKNKVPSDITKDLRPGIILRKFYHCTKARKYIYIYIDELSDCNNFELKIFTLFIPSKNWKLLHVDYMQISIQAVAMLSWQFLVLNNIAFYHCT